MGMRNKNRNSESLMTPEDIFFPNHSKNKRLSRATKIGQSWERMPGVTDFLRQLFPFIFNQLGYEYHQMLITK